MAGWLGAPTPRGMGILFHSRHRDPDRGGPQFHADQSYQGTLLERRDQWCRRRTCDGHCDADDVAAKHHGGIHDRRLATVAWLVIDGGDGGVRARHGGHMDSLTVS